MQLTEISGDIEVPAFVAGTAAGTDIEFPAWMAPWDVTITGVKWVPAAAITANVTNFATLSLRNRTTGAGTAVPATRAYSATDSVAHTPEAMTLSGTAADLVLAAGDVVTLGITHGGTGLLIPAGIVQVTVRRS